jgi:hypothetical protein
MGKMYLFILLCVMWAVSSNVSAQTRTMQVDHESIQYKDGTVTLAVVIPVFKKKLKEAEAASRLRLEMVSKIIDEGVEKTPYNRRFEIDKTIKLDELVRLIGPDIALYDLVISKTMVHARCTFDIKHIERKLIDNGYIRKFGI